MNTPNGWQLSNNFLKREFVFEDFSQAFAFMCRVALYAEKANHHPNWSNVYNRVTIELQSHDVQKVTERDTRFAEAVNRFEK